MRVISPLNRVGLGIVALVCASILSLSTVFAAGAPAAAESIDQLYEKVKKEGGKLTVMLLSRPNPWKSDLLRQAASDDR
jgi:hypothetical protein